MAIGQHSCLGGIYSEVFLVDCLGFLCRGVYILVRMICVPCAGPSRCSCYHRQCCLGSPFLCRPGANLDDFTLNATRSSASSPYVSYFLLLARYVPNVAKRSIWDQCTKKYTLRTNRPTTGRPLIWPILGKFQMAISPRGVVRSASCLVLRWGFRGRRIEWRYFRFRQIQDGGSAAILENSNGDISAADRPIYSVFGSRMGFSGSADRMALIPFWPNSIGMWEKTMREELIRLVTI